MKRSDYESAIQSFERARTQLQDHRGPLRLLVSLASFLTFLQRIEISHHCIWQMSGWKFDDLHIRVRQRLCEALYAAGRKTDASEFLIDLVNTFDEEVNTSVPVAKWVSGELTCAVRFVSMHSKLLYQAVSLHNRKRQ